jgi:hypothetical protein
MGVDPIIWDAFIEMLRRRGHAVSIVTYRDERHDWTPHLRRLEGDGIQICFTRGGAKGWWRSNFGPEIDVWIDDNPVSI